MKQPWVLPAGPLELVELPGAAKGAEGGAVAAPPQQQQQQQRGPASPAGAAAAEEFDEDEDEWEDDEYEDEDVSGKFQGRWCELGAVLAQRVERDNGNKQTTHIKLHQPQLGDANIIQEGEQLETAGFGAHEDEGEEDEGEADQPRAAAATGSSGGGWDAAAGSGGGDMREARGWQRLDRKKMEALVAEVLKEQEAAAALNPAPPSSGEEDEGEEEGAPASPLAVLGGLNLESVHFNSATSRPARKMGGGWGYGWGEASALSMQVLEDNCSLFTIHHTHVHTPSPSLPPGKKSLAPATQGQASVGRPGNAVVWLRQDLRLHDNPALSEAARLAAAQVGWGDCLCGGERGLGLGVRQDLAAAQVGAGALLRLRGEVQAGTEEAELLASFGSHLIPSRPPEPNPNQPQSIDQPQGGTITLLYIHSPKEDGDGPSAGSQWRPGAASRLWAKCALESLQRDLVGAYGAGAEIVFKRGPYLKALEEVGGRLRSSRCIRAWVFHGLSGCAEGSCLLSSLHWHTHHTHPTPTRNPRRLETPERSPRPSRRRASSSGAATSPP